MKKTLLMASVACACAFAANAAYDSWFTGIGASASATNAMGALNGEWVFNITNGEASVNASHKLEFDLDDGETIVFNADQAAAPDTNTITRVAVTGVFTPVKYADLPSDSEMTTRGAQVGFVVGSTVVSELTVYNYYAWVGAQAGHDSGWFPIGDDIAAANIGDETSLVVEFDYSQRTDTAKNYVTFSLVSGSPATTNVLSGGNHVEMTSTAGSRPNNYVAGMTCYGSGTLAAADGAVEIGVATVENVKYATLAAAATAAESATDKTITIVRTTTDSATLPDGVAIYDPDQKASGATITVAADTTVTIKPTAGEIRNGTSGACSVPLNFTGAGTVAVDLTGAPGKEIAGSVNVESSTATFTLQTAKTVLAGVTPSGGKPLTSINSDATKEGSLRSLLNTYATDAYTNAYESVAAAETAIVNALDSVPAEKNGLKLWQDYALGITPEASVKPVTVAADADASYITLEIPDLKGKTASGDYTITYTPAGSTPASIKVPATASGTTEVKVTFTPAE